MVEIALAEGHEEADALHIGDVLGQDSISSWCSRYMSFLPTCGKSYSRWMAWRESRSNGRPPSRSRGAETSRRLTSGLKFVAKGIAVVAAVAVQNVDGVDGVELVLLGVSAVSLGHARVKAAAQQGSQAGSSNFLA